MKNECFKIYKNKFNKLFQQLFSHKVSKLQIGCFLKVYTDIKPLIVSEQPREGLQIFICFIFTILALIFIEIFKSSHIK